MPTHKLTDKRIVQTGLRISVDLRDRLLKAARERLVNFSLNSEIELRLEQSFGAVSRDELMRFIEQVSEGIKQKDKRIAELEKELAGKRRRK